MIGAKDGLVEAMYDYYVEGRNEVLFEGTSSSLGDSQAVAIGFIDGQGYGGYQLTILADQTGLSLEQTYKMSENGVESVATFPLSSISTTSQNLTIGAPFLQRFLKFRIINQTGNPVTNLRVELKSLAASEGNTRTPLSVDPVAQSQALLTQGVIIGQDASGVYRNAKVNQIGALLTGDFKAEVARGLYPGYSYGVKFGRVPDVDTTGANAAPSDIYNGGQEYTGFNATSNEEIAATSGDNNDRGSLVSSGTATGGSHTTLIDTSATFVTDGVAVGDLVINDTQGIHGVITAVNSETQVTVFGMVNGSDDSQSNASGDAYRIATSIDTGAAVIRLTNILDQDYVLQNPVYIILNGTTTVTTSGVNAIRCATGRTVLSGSSGRNEGEITVTQAVSTSNVFCVVPTFGATTIGCFTVPAGKDCLIIGVNRSITRSNGSAGSATIALNVREFGQGFNAERVYELNTSGTAPDQTIIGPFPPGTDIKGTVEQVSDNGTVGEIEIEYFFIDR